MGGILLTIGVILTISWYGWLHLFAFIPLWFFFGHFWGVAPLIGMIRVADVFLPFEFLLTAVAQVFWIFVLRYLLSVLGMSGLFSYFILTGVVTGFLMNPNNLRAERIEFTKNRKPYPWESKK